MSLFYLSVFWLTGVYVGSLLHINALLVGLACIPPLAAALLWYKDARIRTLALCLVALALGLLRYHGALPPADWGTIALHIGPRAVDVGGVIVSEPDIRDQDMRLTVSVYHIGSGRDSYPVTGRIQVHVPRYSDYRYGDDILLKGVLHEPPEDDAFSYKNYLLRQGVYAIMYQPNVELVARDQGNHLLATLYAFKQRLQAAIVLYLPEPHAGLAQGILLGVKAVMTDELKDDLTRTGLTHIVVVSGYNLTVVATLLQRLTERRLRRSLALLLALLGVVIFTLMTGASTPVVRAAVMVSMTLLARAVGRESDALTSLLFTAALLVGLSPLTLWDVSFQLSFLATLGLVLLSPPLERAWQRLPMGIGAILAATIAAQIMTLPVIVLNFHRLSLVGPLANLAVQPAIPPLMVLGALTAAAGLTAHVAVRLLGWMAWLVSSYIVEVMRLLGGLPQASVDLLPPPAGQQPAMLVVYFAIVALVFYTAAHVTRSDITNLPQALRSALVGLRARLLIGALALVAIVVWVAILYLLRTQ